MCDPLNKSKTIRSESSGIFDTTDTATFDECMWKKCFLLLLVFGPIRERGRNDCVGEKMERG